MHIFGYLVQNFIKYLHFSLENCTKCSTFAQLFEKKYNFSREIDFFHTFNKLNLT